MNIHIIMPMAGEGNRFKEKGYDIPKPLIKLNDINSPKPTNAGSYWSTEEEQKLVERRKFLCNQSDLLRSQIGAYRYFVFATSGCTDFNTSCFFCELLKLSTLVSSI